MGKKGDKTKTVIRKTTPVSLVQEELKNVTMEDIYEAAGLSRGGLYTHYGSTGQVLADTINELMSSPKSQAAERVEKDLPAVLMLDELLECYQSEMLDRSGSLGLAFYEYYNGMPLSEDSVMLKQYYISRTVLCSLTKYGISKDESRQANAGAVVDLLLFSYQDIWMLSSITPLDGDSILKGMISGIGAMLVR